MNMVQPSTKNIPISCLPPSTNKKNVWPYDEYYVGHKDEQKRRSGTGENHWTGAESIEWYTGHFVRDTMNGRGDYRWRYRGSDCVFATYEGYFYVNRMHGYGTMSDPNGCTFTGLFHNNIRLGPGIETYANLKANVGLWRGRQLVRLAWRPDAPSVVPDLMSTKNGQVIADQYRTILTKTTKIIGETNNAIELLKQYGADPVSAAAMWPRLYSKHLSDLESQACQVDVFERDYYKGRIFSLEEVSRNSLYSEAQSQGSTDENKDQVLHYAWNNSQIMLNIMKHCYKHEKQRNTTNINLKSILNGPRRLVRPPGCHEKDCRNLLMASFLGHVRDVAILVNENGIYPDLADMQGNTALMYATCGDNADIIHFLIEAGANVNSFNDSCLTPLGVALMRYTCAQKDVEPNKIVQALIPQTLTVPVPGKLFNFEKNISEWKISRDVEEKKISPMPSLKTQIAPGRRQTILKSVPSKEKQYALDDLDSEDNILYSTTCNEYTNKVNQMFSGPNRITPYIFAVNDMVREVINFEEQQNIKKNEKNPKTSKSKTIKQTAKSSKEIIKGQSKGNLERKQGDDNGQKLKVELLLKIQLTILQLLTDGADPKLVRCPQPALLIAISSGSTDLVRSLVKHGVDINEKFPEMLDYTALDIAVANPLTFENVKLIRTLLDNGADVNHRLPYQDAPGPTLLHALLARTTMFEFENEILRQILELMLDYNCDPTVQFNGRSAIDVAMNKLELFDVLIMNPNINLNAVINNLNQTILVKMFSVPFFKEIMLGGDFFAVFTHLLLYGADPLIECQNENEKYKNIFEYAKKMFVESKRTSAKDQTNTFANKLDPKGRKSNVSPSKPSSLLVNFDLNYGQAIDLVTECARILHIKWLQTKLVRDLVSLIYKYKHRPWPMILRVNEYNNQRAVALWLYPQRCMEIWDILNSTRRKIYNNDRIQKFLLYIVLFYNKRSKSFRSNSRISPLITADEKQMIESDIAFMYQEYKSLSTLRLTDNAWRLSYVKPELAVDADKKFKICFECCLPLQNENEMITCTLCNAISFCSPACLKLNIDRLDCHPCSDYLRESLMLKYFQDLSPSDSEINFN